MPNIRWNDARSTDLLRESHLTQDVTLECGAGSICTRSCRAGDGSIDCGVKGRELSSSWSRCQAVDELSCEHHMGVVLSGRERRKEPGDEELSKGRRAVSIPSSSSSCQPASTRILNDARALEGTWADEEFSPRARPPGESRVRTEENGLAGREGRRGSGRAGDRVAVLTGDIARCRYTGMSSR